MKRNTLPKSRNEKVKIIQALVNGKISLDDLKEKKYQISLWQEDKNDPDYLICFAGGNGERITKAEYERQDVIFITMDLNA